MWFQGLALQDYDWGPLALCQSFNVCLNLKYLLLSHAFHLCLYIMTSKTLPNSSNKHYFHRTDFWTLWERARVGWSERIALKRVYYQVWNRPPAQVGCMRQVLRPGALGRPRGMGWRGRWEGGSGWGTHVNPWLIRVNVWEKPVQYCKVISLQLI